MNKVIIDRTENIDKQLLKLVINDSPWEGLKKQLLLDESIDDRVGFVKSNISSILLNKEGELLSYGAFGISNDFSKKIVNNSGFNEKETFLGVYLFTSEKYKGNGFAKTLKEEQIKYIKKNYPNIKYLLGETAKKKTLKTYKKYGAIEVPFQMKTFFKKIKTYYYDIKS